MKPHTPGPWIVGKGIYEGRSIYAAAPAIDDDGFEFHPCIAIVEDNDLDCWDANRSLIAAAPDLLYALDTLVSACKLPGDHCEVEQALPGAIAAIEKALGHNAQAQGRAEGASR